MFDFVSFIFGAVSGIAFSLVIVVLAALHSGKANRKE